MNINTILIRQIHPSFIQNDRVTSQAFRPTPKDKKKLSVYDNDMITPIDAYKHYTEKLGYDSIGVMGISCIECDALDLSYYSDPAPFPEHALIDFSSFSERFVIKKSKLLKNKAELRGWLYREY